MATKNLVPRATGEGQIGTSAKKWSQANFVTGSFDNLSVGSNPNNSQILVYNGSNSFSNVSLSGDATLASNGTLTLSSSATPTFASLTLTASAGLNMSSQKITGLASPVSSNDAANKSYVDGVAQGLDVKNSVRLASTGNIANLSDGCDAGAAIDGVNLVAGDRVLLKDQSTASENGIYVVAGDGVAPSRSADMAAASNAAGVFVFVEEGTTNADKGFVCTSNSSSSSVGTNNLTFSQFSSAGSGLTNLVEDTTPELGGNLDVLSRQILSSTGSISFNAAGSFTFTHNDNSYSFLNIRSSGTNHSGALKLFNKNNTAAVSIKTADSLSSSYTLKLPPNDGADGQVLTTDGSGVLTFATAPGAFTYQTYSSNTTLFALRNRHYSVQHGSLSVTATLDSSSGAGQISFKNMMSSSQNLIVQASSGKTLDGVSSGSVTLTYKQHLTVISDGSGNYEIIAQS